MNTTWKAALPYDSGSRNKLFAITHTGLPGQQALKNTWQVHNDPAALPLHDQTPQQVVLAGVREIKPLYIPKIIEPDPTSIVVVILLPVLDSSPPPYSHKKLSLLLKWASKIFWLIEIIYFTVFSKVWNLNKPQDSRFMCIFLHHCAFHLNWD